MLGVVEDRLDVGEDHGRRVGGQVVAVEGLRRGAGLAVDGEVNGARRAGEPVVAADVSDAFRGPSSRDQSRLVLPCVRRVTCAV